MTSTRPGPISGRRWPRFLRTANGGSTTPASPSSRCGSTAGSTPTAPSQTRSRPPPRGRPPNCTCGSARRACAPRPSWRRSPAPAATRAPPRAGSPGRTPALHGSPRRGRPALPVTPNARGWLALAEAEHERAGRRRTGTWADAARAWDALERPPLAAYCRWRQAEALVAAGRAGPRRGPAPGGARRCAAARCATAAARDRAARRSARARPRRRPRRPTASSGPRAARTDRPRAEVLDLVARGYTNREIAAALVISVKTAGVHVSHIWRSSGRPTGARRRRSRSACAGPGRDAVGSDASRGGRGNERCPPAAGGVERLLGPVEPLRGQVDRGLRPTRRPPAHGRCGPGPR